MTATGQDVVHDGHGTNAPRDGTGAGDVSLVVVGLRRAPTLAACLQSVATNVPPALLREVVVVLNDPSSEVLDELAAVPLDLRVESFAANLGFGGAVDVGVACTTGRYVALLNDDGFVEPGWLEELLATMERHPRCGAVGSTLRNDDGTLQEAGSVIWADGTTWAIGTPAQQGVEFAHRVDYCSAAALLVRREVWDAVGGFDDRWFPAYYEDVDLCLRAAELGWATWYQPHSTVRHGLSKSSNPLFRRFLGRRNQARFQASWPDLLAARPRDRAIERAMWLGMGEPTRVLVIDDDVPAAHRGSGFGRLHHLLLTLAAEDDLYVTLHPTNPSGADASPFTRVGVRVVADLGRHLDQPGVAFDVVVVSRPHNWRWVPVIRRLLPDARIVYDAEALFHRRLDTHAAVAEDPDRRSDLLGAAASMRDTERRIVAEAAQVVCISEDEAAVARAWTNAPVHVLEPWMPGIEPGANGFEARGDVAFVGGWAAGADSPNADGLGWFLQAVWPLVRRAVPDARLHVTGADPPASVRAAAGLDGSVVFTGRVDDLAAFYAERRVAIAPLRYGAGVMIKAIEAIQHGVPLVATETGASGIGGGGRGGVQVVADADPRAFATAVVALLTDPVAWGAAHDRQAATDWSAHARTAGVGRWPEIVRRVAPTRTKEITHAR